MFRLYFFDAYFILSFTGMIVGAASGVLRSVVVKAENRADIVPVDVVINLACQFFCHP
jgi:hypothetical protein